MSVEELDIGGPDRSTGRGQRGARHRAFQFADVARPVIRGQQVLGFGGERLGIERQAVGGAVACEKAVGEDRNIHGAFPQRRQADRESVDAVIQVLTEPALAHEHVERAIGGGDQAEVDVDGAIAAEALKAALFEHAQQFRLRHQRHVAHFIEEQRPAIGEFEAPGLPIVGAGEGALFVAEEFRFEQGVWQRRAIDGLEVFRSPARELVDHAGDHFLARPGWSQDQDRDVRLGRRPDPLEDGQHLLVAADHLAEALHRGRRFFDAQVRPPFEERVEQLRDRVGIGPRRAEGGGVAGDLPHHAELDQFVDAIVDVLPHAAKRLHDLLAVERLFRPRAQEPQDTGAQRRLDEALEPRLDIQFRTGAARAGALCRKGHVIHASPRAGAAARCRARGNTGSGVARSTASCGSHRPFGGRGTGPAPCRRWSR